MKLSQWSQLRGRRNGAGAGQGTSRPFIQRASSAPHLRRAQDVRSDRSGNAAEARLIIENVHKTYDGVPALCGINLEVKAGEILAILGLNGAGKTTLISVVAGLQQPDSGRIWLDGIDIRDQPRSARRTIGLVPQSTGVYPTLRVRENLQFFGELGGLKGKPLGTRVCDVAEALDLAHLLQRPVRNLSGGEARRLHVAMIMMCRPPILLLDEPTVGVDVESRAHFIDFIKTLADDGTSICYSTHYMAEVEQLAASVAILDDGRIIAREGLASLIASRGKSLVELQFEGEPPILPNRANVHREGAILRITTERPPAEEAAKLVAELHDAGHTLKAIVLIQPSLESVFFELTGRAFVSGQPEDAA
jgi:ABC-2 type transport system ATP-binding protein